MGKQGLGTGQVPFFDCVTFATSISINLTPVLRPFLLLNWNGNGNAYTYGSGSMWAVFHIKRNSWLGVISVPGIVFGPPSLKTVSSQGLRGSSGGILENRRALDEL